MPYPLAHVLLPSGTHDPRSGTQTWLFVQNIGFTTLARRTYWMGRLRGAPLIARAFVLSLALLPLGLLVTAQVAQASVDEIEVRVAARRLDDGRTEFAIQERQAGGVWGERRLPRARFFPPDASVGRWLASSPLTVSLPGVTDIEVRVATQLVADGRMEFAIQERRGGERWTERRLPRARFFPADAAVDRWLASSPLAVSDLPPNMPAPTIVVPFSIREFTNGRWLEQQHPQLASTIKKLGWVEDGISETEAEAIQDLLFIVVTSRSVASSIVSFPWVKDGIEEAEAEAVNWLNNIGSEEVATAVVSLGWVEDGIGAIEAGAIEQISYIDYGSSTIAKSVVSLAWVKDGIEEVEAEAINWLRNIGSEEVAAAVVSLGWVEDGIGAIEAGAIEQISYIDYGSSTIAKSVVSLAWVKDGIEEVEAEAINWLRNIGSEEVAAAVVSLGWVEDGIEEAEVIAIEYLSYVANEDSATARLLVSFNWVRDVVGPLEADGIRWISNFVTPEIAASVAGLNWVSDGVTGLEVQLIEELSYLSNAHPVQAMKIVGMQFLESVDPPDLAAVEALSDLSAFRPEDFEIVISHPTVQDGITDDEAKIAATLFGVSRFGPKLLNTLLDPDQVSLEERVLDLPLAGETLLAIIRIGPGTERSMDLLDHAVRHAEEFMASPFPTGYVGWLVGDAVTPTFAGNNFGTNITTLPQYDSELAEAAGALVAHEVAHYYWSGNSAWVDEGIADLMASVSENARTGQPVEVTNSPCGYVRTIVELESLDISSDDGADSAFGCNYSLGERLFVDLYRRLGKEVFRQGLRGLYLNSIARGVDEAQEGMEVGISDVRAAFRDDGGGDATVDVVAARWYEGTEPYDNSAQDTGQPNPLLRTINGRIHLAYLAATREGPPISTISVGAIDDRLWLLIRWTYTVGSDTEVPLELVHYYEDGFEFGHRSVSFAADARHNDSLWWWWLPVGLSHRMCGGPPASIGSTSTTKVASWSIWSTWLRSRARLLGLKQPCQPGRVATSSRPRAGPVTALDGLFRPNGLQRRNCGVKMYTHTKERIGSNMVEGMAQFMTGESMRVSERGQITIPKVLRERLSLHHGVEVEISATDQGLLIRKRAAVPHPVDRVAGVLDGAEFDIYELR